MPNFTAVAAFLTELRWLKVFQDVKM